MLFFAPIVFSVTLCNDRKLKNTMSTEVEGLLRERVADVVRVNITTVPVCMDRYRMRTVGGRKP